MMPKYFLPLRGLLLLLIGVGGCTTSPDAVPPQDTAGRYIVMLADEGVREQDLREQGPREQGLEPLSQRVSTLATELQLDAGPPLGIIDGFVAHNVSAATERVLRADPRVAHLEPDQPVRLYSTQSDAPWHLDRIDQRDLPLDSSYQYDASGAGVDVYVVDSGILATHAEFGGRVAGGYSSVDDNWGISDCLGHGTHVAGIVGGATYGAAKDVTLYSVRVIDCFEDGSIAGVIEGLDWIRTRVAAHPDRPAVVNMSIGGSASTALETAVDSLVGAGLSVVAAAGNNGGSACNYSPGNARSALTVGASTQSDTLAYFSNYGWCVDLFAPGMAITSSWQTNNTALNTINGTSMAAPLVSAAVARYLEGRPGALPSEVAAHILDGASDDKLIGLDAASPNQLLYMGPSDDGCAVCGRYSAMLAQPGAYSYQPDGGYFESDAGPHRAELHGPDGADFDLDLWWWDAEQGGWRVVARATSPSARETLTYDGPAGLYLWRVAAYSGSGTYTLDITHP